MNIQFIYYKNCKNKKQIENFNYFVNGVKLLAIKLNNKNINFIVTNEKDNYNVL
jgi:hypothetical protein